MTDETGKGIVQDYISGLTWSAERTDMEITLVAGNIRGFAGFLARQIEELKKSRNFPGMDGGEYDQALNDVIALLKN